MFKNRSIELNDNLTNSTRLKFKPLKAHNKYEIQYFSSNIKVVFN